MIKVRALSIIGVALFACVLLIVLSVVAHRTADPTDVSLIQLISNADKYDGKAVRVIGFLRLEFEGNALYLHREDYEQSMTKNAIWVDGGPGMDGKGNQLDKKYVLLEGTFDAKHYGHMDLFSGEIRQVKRAEPWAFDRLKKNLAIDRLNQ